MIYKGRRNNYRGRPKPDLSDKHPINEKITHPEVRVVGEGIETGVYPIQQALAIAKEKGVDLVEIASSGNPPVCRVTDYSKFLYEQKRKKKEIKAGSKQSTVKEIRFGPNTEQHDFEFKLKHAVKFLSGGEKVRAFVHFKGRSIVYKEKGEELLMRLAEELEAYGKVEKAPHLEGKRMFVVIAPKNVK